MTEIQVKYFHFFFSLFTLGIYITVHFKQESSCIEYLVCLKENFWKRLSDETKL